MTIEDESVVYMAVADGHGSDKYDMSQYGSKLAVKSALAVMQELYEQFASMPVELARSFRQDLPRLVVRRWHDEVAADAAARGIEEAEPSADKKQLYSRYGTTLLAVLCTPRMRLFAQIGDGDIVLVGPEGYTDVPFQSASNEQLGNATYSMCSEDAHLLWATAQRAVTEEPSLVLLCTDGLSNCFGDEASFRQFAGSLFNNFQSLNVYRFSRSLPDVFQDYSKRGSGDDIAISILFWNGTSLEAAEETQTVPEGETEHSAADRTEA